MANSASADEVELTTVGIDVGSATSHLLFSRLLLRRRTDRLTSRFTVVRRTPLHASPVILTPYVRGELIDQARLEAFVGAHYAEASLTPADIDTGAVVLTGTALLRRNARAVADILAAHAGRLVAASAGHHFESVLAAHGSGAVALSRNGRRVLNVDIGGGTTKLALAANGQVTDTAALAVGSRLVTWDSGRTVQTVHPSLVPSADIPAFSVGSILSPAAENELAAALVGGIGAFLAGQSQPEGGVGVVLRARGTEWSADAVVFSGGVAEYVYNRERREFGDLGTRLGHEVRRQSPDWGLGDRFENQAGIRATVVGAGQHSAQVSGSTIFIGAEHPLPLSKLPVVRVHISGDQGPGEVARSILTDLRRQTDRGDDRLPALAISWPYPPEYPRLRILAEGIARMVDSQSDPVQQLVLAVEQDIAHTLGRILVDELSIPCALVCIDCIEVNDLDYLDIGVPLQPSGVVPVVVRSLLFPGPGDFTQNTLISTVEGEMR